ncbi:unnamed protein product [Victoria cruziana]
MTVPDARKDFLMVNMGPHHPSMHGILQLIVTLDGEDVIECKPILTTMFTEAITVNAPKELKNIQVPKRASYIRVIMLELSCIASHLLWLGPFMADISAQTSFFYIFRERKLLYDLFEAATDKCLDFYDYFLTGVVEYQKLITCNPIFLEREAINWGLSGPMLRAFGNQWDLRKVNRYECYDEFDWEVQWQKEGDSLARYLVRIGEMAESIKIIQQPSPSFELSKQELYVRVEAPKGELGIFLIGDNSVFPWRWKIHPPGFFSLKILPRLVKRMKLADIMTIIGSIDIIMGKVDR